MSLKHLIVTAAAATTIALSGAVFAQTASDQAAAAAQAEHRANAATDEANRQPPGSAERNLDNKVDAATAADAKYHGNRTEANRVARDKAEAEAAGASGLARPADEPTRR